MRGEDGGVYCGSMDGPNKCQGLARDRGLDRAGQDTAIHPPWTAGEEYWTHHTLPCHTIPPPSLVGNPYHTIPYPTPPYDEEATPPFGRGPRTWNNDDSRANPPQHWLS